MLSKGKSYSASFNHGDRQLVMSVFGDPKQRFEACFTATVSYIRGGGESVGIEPIGFSQVTDSTIVSLNGAILKWLTESDLSHFADTRVMSKLREVFAKAGYR